jgi:enediyne biosynthesis protein E4
MAICPAPITPDKRLNDWWVENPWLIGSKGKSLSGYERNRVFWNAGGREFLEISGISNGADSDGDARASLAADLNHDGRQDLIVRQAGGGSFLMFENHFAPAGWLKVSLRGTKSNSRGVGARATAYVGSRKIVRELFPPNSFVSQGSEILHFGLGDAKRVDRLEIRWPSGSLQSFANVAADQHLKITEATDELAQVTRPAE